MPLIETHEARTAGEFISVLQKSDDKWWDLTKGVQRWVFRGLGTTKYNLIPSSRRPLEINPLRRLIERIGDPEDPQTWLEAEKWSVNEFTNLASSQGLDTHTVTSVKQRLGLEAGAYTVPDILKAQHHGIPTNFLDWTFDPKIATYFAAASAAEQIKTRNNSTLIGPPEALKFCVWAFDRYTEFVDLFVEEIGGNTLANAGFYLEYDEPSKNDYLRLQEGMFVGLSWANIFFRKVGRWPSMEDYCDLKFIRGNHTDQTILRKFVLSETQLPRLLEILEREGMVRSTIMPTLDNVAMDVLDRIDRRF